MSSQPKPDARPRAPGRPGEGSSTEGQVQRVVSDSNLLRPEALKSAPEMRAHVCASSRINNSPLTHSTDIPKDSFLVKRLPVLVSM